MIVEQLMMLMGYNANHGRLELINNDILRYVKFKNQEYRKDDFITTPLSNMVSLFKKEKIMFEIEVSSILKLELINGKSLLKYGKVVISTDTNRYTVNFEKKVRNKINKLYNNIVCLLEKTE